MNVEAKALKILIIAVLRTQGEENQVKKIRDFLNHSQGNHEVSKIPGLKQELINMESALMDATSPQLDLLFSKLLK